MNGTRDDMNFNHLT